MLPLALTEQKAFVPNWGTKCFWIFNGLTDFPRCPVCGRTYGDRKNVSVGTGYNGHCSNRCKTLDSDVQKKISDTCMEKFGCSWSSKSVAVRRAYADTCRRKYGVDNVFRLDSVKEKSRRTNLERHGDENYRNDAKRVETNTKLYGQGVNGKAIGETLKNMPADKKAEWRKNIQNAKLEKYGDKDWNNPGRRRKTCMEKYGVLNAVQSDQAKVKTKNTFLERYGCDHAWKSPDVRKSMRERHFAKYGVEYPMQRDETKDAAKKTKLEKFGMARSPSWRYRYDGLSFDSGWELAFYICLSDTGADFRYPCDVSFDYVDSYGKSHVYSPDFRVGDKIIEIKGGQFLDESGKLILPYRKSLSEDEYDRLQATYDAKYRCMIEHGVAVYGEDEI